MRLLAPLAAVAAALVMAPGAWAAANRSGDLPQVGSNYTWTSASGTGLVFSSDVSDHVPACSPVFSCDTTLVKTEDYGNLLVEIADSSGGTLKDVDLHVYVSNENGDQGELVGESISDQANEAYLAEDVPAGYYLVYVDWYLGTGTVDGTATLQEPTDPTDEPPVFVPAEPAAGDYAGRQYAFGAADHEPQAWTSTPNAGVSDAQDAAGCVQINCDFTLIHVVDRGVLTLSSSSALPTVADLDIHLLASDAGGTAGEEVLAATTFGPSETLVADLDPGWYLMRVDTTGAGTYDGTASWSEPPVEEPDPTEE